MIIKIGPITVMDNRTRAAYRVLANKAYALHQAVWYTDDLCLPQAQERIKLLDSELSDAISRVPASEIDAA